jgi:ABC-type uncharacterized transport system substrate-binding protein
MARSMGHVWGTANSLRMLGRLTLQEGKLDQAAAIVDKVLKGRKPADLPVEHPTKFDFAINLTTAQALGRTILQSISQQATLIVQ